MNFNLRYFAKAIIAVIILLMITSCSSIRTSGKRRNCDCPRWSSIENKQSSDYAAREFLTPSLTHIVPVVRAEDFLQRSPLDLLENYCG